MKTHDYILFFSNKGKVYRTKGYEIPQFSRQSKGLPIVNLLPLEREEIINSVVIIDAENELNKYLTFITKQGLIKRTEISEYEKIRSTGKIAILLKEEDELISVIKTTGNNEIIIGASNGRMVRFSEDEVRSTGRVSSGVKGININNTEYVVGADLILGNENVLVITKNGYGKQTSIAEYRLTHRGGKGVKALNINDKNGEIVSFQTVVGEEDIMIISDNGIIIRIPLEQISTLRRVTQGVKLINLKDDQKVANATKIAKEEYVD